MFLIVVMCLHVFLMVVMCSLMCTTVYIVRHWWHVCHVCIHVWTQVNMG